MTNLSLITASLSVATACLLFGCDGLKKKTKSELVESGEYGEARTYKGPGRYFTLDVAAGGGVNLKFGETYESTTLTTVQGAMDYLDNGFTKVAVTENLGSLGPLKDESFYGVDLPGFGFLLRPFDSAMPPVMLLQTECPTEDIETNNVTVDSPKYPTLDTQAFWGIAKLTKASNIYEVTKEYSLQSFLRVGTEARNVSSVACDGGVTTIDKTDGQQSYIWHTKTAMVLSSIASKRSTTTIALPKMGVAQHILAGDYVGFAFDDSDTSAPLFAVSSTFEKKGETLMTVTALSDDTTSSTTTKYTFKMLTDTIMNEPHDGFFGVTYTRETTSRNMACAGAYGLGDSMDRKMIVCSGQGYTTASKLFSMVLISKPVKL